MSMSSGNEPEQRIDGTVVWTVTPGEKWKRPACWILGHKWRSPADERSCIRCGAGTLSKPLTVEKQAHEAYITTFDDNKTEEWLSDGFRGYTVPEDVGRVVPRGGWGGRGSDPIQDLREEHGDATVEVYGEATLRALDEWDVDGDGVHELLSGVRPLATVDLGELAPTETDIDPDDHPIEDRLKGVHEVAGGEEYIETRRLYEAHEANAALLIHEAESE
jgi:hypothetical protein